MTDTPGTTVATIARNAVSYPTNELRFELRHQVEDEHGFPRDLRILQQKWRVQVNMDMPTFEWRDVPMVEA